MLSLITKGTKKSFLTNAGPILASSMSYAEDSRGRGKRIAIPEQLFPAQGSLPCKSSLPGPRLWAQVQFCLVRGRINPRDLHNAKFVVVRGGPILTQETVRVRVLELQLHVLQSVVL